MKLKKTLALCLLLALLPTAGLATMIMPSAAPINRRVDRNTAKTLAYLPENAKARTDTLVIGVPDLLGEINPFWAQTTGDDYVASLLFDELLFANNDGEIGPGVATYEASADGRTYTFTIKDSVRYPDNTPLRSDDFINALYLLLTPGYDGSYDISRADIDGVAAYLQGDAGTITGIQRLSDAAFSVTLASTNANDLAYLAIPALRLTHVGDMCRPADLTDPDAFPAFYEETLATARKAEAAPMAYGQYLLDSLKVGNIATLTKNDAYWRGTPYIGTVELLVVPVGGELDAIMEGTVDIISMIGSVEAVDTVADFETGFINLYTWEGNTIGYLGMDLENALFSDVSVRQALAMGFDRDAARKNHVERYGSVPSMILFDSFSASASTISGELRDQFTFNPERAAQLLEDAGWVLEEDGLLHRGGQTFTIKLLYNTPNPIMEAVTTQMQMDYQHLGIELALEPVPFDTLVERTNAGDYEMYFQARRLPYDPALASDLFAGDSHLNTSGYTSDMMARLIAMADTADTQERENVLYEMLYQELFLDMPVIPLYRRFEFLLTNARVMNITVTTSHDITADVYRFFFTDTLEGHI